MEDYCILTHTKIKSFGAGKAGLDSIENELRRLLKEKRDGSPHNWDPARSELNHIGLQPDGLSLADAVRERIGDQHIRKNAVLALEILATFSPEMKGKVPIPEWRKANRKFIEQEYPGGCVFSVFHDDETTPHEHFIVVPFCGKTKDGKPKLNARGLTGGKHRGPILLRKRLDRYAEAMRPFKLRRGVAESGAKRVTLKKMRADDARVQNQIDRLAAIEKEAKGDPAYFWAYLPEMMGIFESLRSSIESSSLAAQHKKKMKAMTEQKIAADKKQIELFEEVRRLRELIAKRSGGTDKAEEMNI